MGLYGNLVLNEGLFFNRNDPKLTDEELKSKSATLNKIKEIINYYKENNKESKLSKYLKTVIYAVLAQQGERNAGRINESDYQVGTTFASVKLVKEYLDYKDCNQIYQEIVVSIKYLEKAINESDDTSKIKILKQSLEECKNIQKLLK